MKQPKKPTLKQLKKRPAMFVAYDDSIWIVNPNRQPDVYSERYKCFTHPVLIWSHIEFLDESHFTFVSWL